MTHTVKSSDAKDSCSPEPGRTAAALVYQDLQNQNCGGQNQESMALPVSRGSPLSKKLARYRIFKHGSGWESPVFSYPHPASKCVTDLAWGANVTIDSLEVSLKVLVDDQGGEAVVVN